MISFDVHTNEFRLKPIRLTAKEEIGAVAIESERERITEAVNVNDDPAKPLAHRYAYEKKLRGGKPIRDLTLTGDMLRSRTIESIEGNEIRIAFADDRETEKARKNDAIDQMTGLSPRNQEEVVQEFRRVYS